MPETSDIPRLKVKVAVLTVKGSIASLNVAARFLPSRTSVAPFAGTVKVTIGAVVSGVAPVVKVHTWSLASGLPARSRAPVVIVAVYRVLGARATVGLKVAVTPA